MRPAPFAAHATLLGSLWAGALLWPGVACAAGAQAPEVTIQYTADLGGLYRFDHRIEELNALTDPGARGNLRLNRVEVDMAVLRHGPWAIWGTGAPPSPEAAQAWFGGAGLRVEGQGQALLMMRSEANAFAQLPDEHAPWLIDWLWDENRRSHRRPDLRLGQGRLFQARGADGTALSLFSEDGTAPSGALLRSPMQWHWGMRGVFPITRGQQRAQLLALTDGQGGGTVRVLADQAASNHLVRVDLGNAVGRNGSEEGPQAVDDSVAALAASRLDALVPDEQELRLSQSQWGQLAQSVPLVACNLTPPAGWAQPKPYVVVARDGLRLAIVGLADADRLTRRGLVGGRSGWKAQSGSASLRQACRTARQLGADALVVATTHSVATLNALGTEWPGVVAVLVAEQLHDESLFREQVAPQGPMPMTPVRPWLTTGVSNGSLGRLTLRFAPTGHQPAWAPTALDNRIQRVFQSMAPVPQRSWRGHALRHQMALTGGESLLPDPRQVLAPEALEPGQPPEPPLQYRSLERGRLGASILREALGAEVAVLEPARSGINAVGEVPGWFINTWFRGADRTGTIVLTGAQMKALLTQDPDGERWVWAGVDPQGKLLGGRPIDPEERYRVATTEDLAISESFVALSSEDEALPFEAVSPGAWQSLGLRSAPAGSTQRDGLLLRELVTARLEAMKRRHAGFSPAYLAELRTLLGDDGSQVQPRWSLALRPVEGNFQQLRVSNRAPFGAVRNAFINLPDNTLLGLKGQAALVYEGAPVDWDSRVKLGYQRLEFFDAQGSSVQEQADNLFLSSELRLKVFTLHTMGLGQSQEAGPLAPGVSLVPYVGATYQTEFTPTDNQDSGAQNPLRRELNGTLGAVLRPGGVVQELRLGALLEQDFAVARGGNEAGMQLAAILQQRLGPATLRVEGDLKHYFLTLEDTPDDLGTLATVDVGLSYPIWGALALRMGVTGLAFTGKVPATSSWGTSLTPSVGLSLNSTWKPLVGLAY